MLLSSMWISNQNHFITFQVLVLTTVLDHSQVSLSMVLRPHLLPIPKVGSERARTHDKRVISLLAPISKYVLRIISQ